MGEVSRRCSKCICDDCSKNKRQLSRKDPKFYRVCDHCDKRMEYARIEILFKDVSKSRTNLLDAYKSKIEMLKEKQIAREKKMTALNNNVNGKNYIDKIHGWRVRKEGRRISKEM